MEERVGDRGKSERQSVIDWIGIRNLSYLERVQTSTWCNSRQTADSTLVVIQNTVPKGRSTPFGGTATSADSTIRGQA